VIILSVSSSVATHEQRKCCIFGFFAFFLSSFICLSITLKEEGKDNSMSYFHIFLFPQGADTIFCQLKAFKMEVFSMKISMQSK